MIEIEILSPDQNVWARSMALIEDPHVASSSCYQAKIQYNHYAMPGEIVPLQEQLERKKLAMITSTAAGEKE